VLQLQSYYFERERGDTRV